MEARDIAGCLDILSGSKGSQISYQSISDSDNDFDEVFSPGHGDDIITEATRSEEIPRCACYNPLLLNTLAQSASEAFPEPLMWLAYSADDGTIIAIPAANEAVPNIEWIEDVMSYDPVWERNNCPGAHWARINRPGEFHRPTAGIESMDILGNTRAEFVGMKVANVMPFISKRGFNMHGSEKKM
ncbi:hypothetical protein GJ496_001592 [Pomphorhynchus laevis]|nr:hypothetical protein GJ496_001592 [Pomphorhynchus laevis]